jgi:hypothetical protein
MEMSEHILKYLSSIVKYLLQRDSSPVGASRLQQQERQHYQRWCYGVGDPTASSARNRRDHERDRKFGRDGRECERESHVEPIVRFL